MKRLEVIVLSLLSIILASCVSLDEFLEIKQKASKRAYATRAASKPAPETGPDEIKIPPVNRGWHTVHGRVFHEKFKEIIFARKTDACLECHMKSEYRIFDPHMQLNANGDIILEKCLYCHSERPDVEKAEFKDVKLIEVPERICLRCHNSYFKSKHPANADHVRRPSHKMLSMIKEFESIMELTLPLDYQGRIMCATCHNPHEKGVIPDEKAGAKGAGEQYRIRMPEQTELDGAHRKREALGFHMPGRGDQICLACHLDK